MYYLTVNDAVNALENAVMHNGCGDAVLTDIEFVKTEKGVTCHFILEDGSVIKVKHRKKKEHKEEPKE